MSPSNDLELLWQSQSVMTGEEVRAMLEKVRQQTKSFERKIFWRNTREYVAAAIVAVAFASLGHRAHGVLEQFGYYWVAASGLWIIVYAWLRQRERPAPTGELNIREYRNRLLEKYDRQITLLRQAKYWYVLPPYIGLLLASAAHLERDWQMKHRFYWLDLLLPVFLTLVSGWVWYLNEGPALRHLRQQRSRLLEMLHGAEELV